MKKLSSLYSSLSWTVLTWADGSVPLVDGEKWYNHWSSAFLPENSVNTYYCRKNLLNIILRLLLPTEIPWTRILASSKAQAGNIHPLAAGIQSKSNWGQKRTEPDQESERKEGSSGTISKTAEGQRSDAGSVGKCASLWSTHTHTRTHSLTHTHTHIKTSLTK